MDKLQLQEGKSQGDGNNLDRVLTVLNTVRHIVCFFLHSTFLNEDTRIQRTHVTSQSQHSEEVTDLGHEAGLSNSLLALYFANYFIVKCFKDRD